MAKKPTFNEKEIAEDIDDFFGPPATTTAAATTQPAVSAVAAPTEPAPVAHKTTPAAAETAPRRAGARAKPGPPRTTRSQMTVDLPVSVASRLRGRWRQDRVEGGKGRTYAAIVMDAIDNNADRLATHWTTTTTAASSRFPSRSKLAATPARSEPVDRIGLSGLTEADRDVLETLCADWSAPSWTELISVALDYELPPTP